MSVAAAVLSGRADAGLGIHAAARALGLDFIPVVTEEYDLIIPDRFFNTNRVQTLIETIRTDAFKHRVQALGDMALKRPVKYYLKDSVSETMKPFPEVRWQTWISNARFMISRRPWNIPWQRSINSTRSSLGKILEIPGIILCPSPGALHLLPFVHGNIVDPVFTRIDLPGT